MQMSQQLEGWRTSILERRKYGTDRVVLSLRQMDNSQPLAVQLLGRSSLHFVRLLCLRSELYIRAPDKYHVNAACMGALMAVPRHGGVT